MSWTKLRNYLLCMTLIFLSGSPALTKNSFELYISVFFVVVVGFAVLNSVAISRKAIVLVVIFGFLMLGHIAVFGQWVAFASIGFMLQMITAILIAALIPQFARYFVHCMFLVALVSLFFYFLFQLPRTQEVFAAYDLAGDDGKINIGLYTFFRTWGEKTPRNSGIFWEPGALAGYLAIALYMVAILGRSLKVSMLEVATIIVALGTTMSTMGYLAFAVVCGAYFVRRFSGTNPLLVFVGLPLAFCVLVIIAFQAAESIPFLKEKIVGQIEDVEIGAERQEINRIGNALYDLEFVASRPIIGWSANVATRTEEDNLALQLLSGQGNALTGFAVRFGIIGWITMIAAFLTAFFTLSRSLPIALLGVVLIAIMFTGEKYMNFPLIMTFMFLNQKHAKSLVKARRRRRRRMPARSPASPRARRSSSGAVARSSKPVPGAVSPKIVRQ